MFGREHQYLFLGLAFIMSCLTANSTQPGMPHADSALVTNARLQLKHPQVKFRENKGQVADMDHRPVSFVLFKTEAPGLDLYITEKGLTYVFLQREQMETPLPQNNPLSLPRNNSIKWERIEMELKGSSIKKENISKELPSENHYNYFLPHCSNGLYNVSEYEKLTIKEIYPGIDWVLYNSSGNGFKYDFVIHPGADPLQIEMIYSSLQPLTLTKEGSLFLKSKLGSITENSPYSYIKETGKEIKSNYRISLLQKKEFFETTVKFELGRNPNDQQSTLIIDPQLVWATFFGPSGSSSNAARAYGTVTDSSGNLFITGFTYASNFPLKNSGSFFQGTISGTDVFITKFDNTGALVWSTFYGGSMSDYGIAITCDKLQNIFITGSTDSPNFPLQNAGTFFEASNKYTDIFIIKFDNPGNRLWATFYGGTDVSNVDTETGTSITTDTNANVYVAGYTTAPDFPLQNSGGFFQSTLTPNGVSPIIIKFDNIGNRLWSTYFGSGTSVINDITADINNNLIIAGFISYTASIPLMDPGSGAYFQAARSGSNEAFLGKFNAAGNLTWATYYGGSDEDWIASVVTDAQGNIFAAGITQSPDLPLQDAGTYFQAAATTGSWVRTPFILKFTSGCVRQWATYYGSSGFNWLFRGNSLAIDPCANVYICFETSTKNIEVKPSCEGGFTGDSSSITGVPSDIFLARFLNNGTLEWSGYFGGNGSEADNQIAIDRSGNLFTVSNHLQSGNSYPFTNPGGGAYYDTISSSNKIFISKFIPIQKIKSASEFQFNGPVCNSNLNLLPDTQPGFISGGTFSSTPGLSIHPLTGQITLSASIPGSYVVSYFPLNCWCPDAKNKTSDTVIISFGYSLTINSPAICSGNSTILTAETNPSTSISYSWSDAGTTASAIVVSPSVNTSYTVYTLNDAGCANQAVATVSVHPLFLKVNPDVIVEMGSIITLTATGGTTYSWNPPEELSCSDCADPSVSTLQNKQYCVAASDGTCINEACVNIEVFCPGNEKLNTPNAFTPNGDGINDNFCLRGWNFCVEHFSVLIFNRWGEKVFESTNAAFCWDGIYNGRPLESDVYMFRIEAYYSSGSRVVKNGDITLIR